MTTQTIHLSPEYPTKCKVCDAEILIGDPHVTEKAWKKYGDLGWSVIFDITLCMGCTRNKQQNISQESRRRIEAYIAENNPNSTDDAFEQCHITGKPLTDCHFVQGAMMVHGNQTAIIMMSDEAIEALQNQLSEETKDELDRFAEEQLGPPGAWKDLFSPTRPILM